MMLNLAPQMADKKNDEGEGGSYYSWSSFNFPLLSEAKVGAGKLVLHPHGFALPHYADSHKIGYVLQGSCTVGMVFPNSPEEKVLIIKKGDAITVEKGVVSWWFNGEDSDLIMVFIGETSKAHIPGEFTYFFLAGAVGLLGGFSQELVSKTYNLNEEESKKLTKRQTGVVVVKLEKNLNMPQPSKECPNNPMIFNLEKALPDVNVENGGLLTTLTATKLPLLEKVGLSVRLVKLDANALCSPMYITDSAVEVIYVVKGSGRIQIVGINGENLLETKVQAGELFVVPPFFVVSKIADGEGMECFSVITSSQPTFGELSGNTSVWKAFSPVVVQASLNVSPKFAELFTSKITETTTFIPPKL